MIYEVSATLYFGSEDEANDFYHDCEVAMAKAIVVHPHQPNQQTGGIFQAHCYHDETPPVPCDVYKEDHPVP